MILYLCRHGAAEDPRPGQRDAQRALTQEGIKKFRQAARGLQEVAPDIRAIISSPLLRARQTAEILADVLAHHKRSVEVTASEALAPPGDLAALLAQLRQLGPDVGDEEAGAVAVAHEPFLGAWVGELCFGRAGACQMKKGAVAALELDPRHRHARLLWLLQPGHLRAMG